MTLRSGQNVRTLVTAWSFYLFIYLLADLYWPKRKPDPFTPRPPPNQRHPFPTVSAGAAEGAYSASYPEGAVRPGNRLLLHFVRAANPEDSFSPRKTLTAVHAGTTERCRRSRELFSSPAPESDGCFSSHPLYNQLPSRGRHFRFVPEIFARACRRSVRARLRVR